MNIADLRLSEQQLLQSLDLDHLPETDKKETVAALLEHFQSLILDATINQLNPDQQIEFEKALRLSSPNRENKITEITSQVPGLTKTLERTIEKELITIKSAYNSIK
jgi:hypothetical protein